MPGDRATSGAEAGPPTDVSRYEKLGRRACLPSLFLILAYIFLHNFTVHYSVYLGYLYSIIFYIFSERNELASRIGEGTYGVVYRARDRVSGEMCALKKVRMDKACLWWTVRLDSYTANDCLRKT